MYSLIFKNNLLFSSNQNLRSKMLKDTFKSLEGKGGKKNKAWKLSDINR